MDSYMIDQNSSVEDKWVNIRPVNFKILNQESISNDEWQDSFRSVHSACIWGKDDPPKVYGALKKDIKQHIKEAQKRVVSHEGDEAFLKAYTTEWDRFFTQSEYLEKPFHMLKFSVGSGKLIYSSYNTDQRTLSLVRKVMLELWKETIFSDLKNRLECSTVKLLQAERNGEAFDSQLIIAVRQSYVNLSSNPDDKLAIYRENYEKFYLEAIRSFYHVKASEYQGSNGLPSYLRYADKKLKEEGKRAQKYLVVYDGSARILTECCVKILVTQFTETILEQCTPMIINKDYENLQLIVKLMDRVTDGLNPMLEVVEKYLGQYFLTCSLGMKATDIQDYKYVEHLIDLFKKSSELVNEAFANHPKFRSSCEKVFKRVINDPDAFNSQMPLTQQQQGNKIQLESKCPVLLANFCDTLLRKTTLSKKLGSEGIGNKLTELLQILKYVENKDVFMKYHKLHLTRRLLLGISDDNEKEELLQTGLRDIDMPAECVSNLSKMFQDVKLSQDLNRQFQEQRSADSGNHFIDSIKVLNSGAWTFGSRSVPVTLPTGLEDLILKVEDFYGKIRSGRTLQWFHQMSHGTVTFANEVGKFDLEVTTFQMSVLFAWNERPNDKITLDDLRLATELDEPELRKTLWSLAACPKLKSQILLYSGDAKTHDDFENNTLFSINQKFSTISKKGKTQKRGKVNLIGRLPFSTEKSADENNEAILSLRRFRIQEAIGKIMKMRKRINIDQLQMETIELLKNMFLPSKKMIEEQIEWHLENECIKRDEVDTNTFIYVE